MELHNRDDEYNAVDLDQARNILLNKWHTIIKKIVYVIAEILQIPQHDDIYEIFSDIQFFTYKSSEPVLFLNEQIAVIKAVPNRFKDAHNWYMLNKTTNGALNCLYKICSISSIMYTYRYDEYFYLANLAWTYYYSYYETAYDVRISIRPLRTIPKILESHHTVNIVRPPQNQSIKWYLRNNWKEYILSVLVVPLDGDEQGKTIRLFKFIEDYAIGGVGLKKRDIPLSTRIELQF